MTLLSALRVYGIEMIDGLDIYIYVLYKRHFFKPLYIIFFKKIYDVITSKNKKKYSRSFQGGRDPWDGSIVI
jgi:hypothetical protein